MGTRIWRSLGEPVALVISNTYPLVDDCCRQLADARPVVQESVYREHLTSVHGYDDSDIQGEPPDASVQWRTLSDPADPSTRLIELQ